jgi:hypothetical protein
VSTVRFVPYLLILAVWIHAFVDCLGTPEHQVRRLPKLAWLLIVLLLGPVLIGPLAWLALGRRRGPVLRGEPGRPWQGAYGPDLGGYRGGPADRVRDGLAGPAQRAPEPGADWIPPDDNPEFLRSLDERRKKGTQD